MLRVVAALLALSASACFTKPDPPLARSTSDGGAGGGDSAGSGSGSDASDACTVHDDFNAVALGCGDWSMPANVLSSVDVRHEGATLQMVSLGGGTALCSSTDTVDIVGGARVQVTSIISDVNSSLTFDVVDFFATTRVGVRISGAGANTPHADFLATGIAPVAAPYDAANMKYWQLRSEEQTFATAQISHTDVIVEYSRDASTWTELGRFNAGSTKFTSSNVRLSASFSGQSSDVAEFDNLDACN